MNSLFHRNSIVKAAVEELAADKAAAAQAAAASGADGAPEGGTSPNSTEQVASTDVENVDAVAELQERVAVLEDENAVLETDMIEASGAKVQDDLDEAIDSAIALENLGLLALATYKNGTASLQSNAGIAIGLEHICSNLQMPCIVAAVEADGVDDQGSGAKNLGERALAASKNLIKSVLAFLKKIKDWAVGFINEQVNGVGRLFQTLKSLEKDMNQLKAGAVIDDEQFIKSVGFLSENPYKDFSDYIEFSSAALKYFSDGTLYRDIGQLMRRDAADKTESIFGKVMGDIGRVFPAKVFNGGTGMASGPIILGGSQFVLAHNNGEGGTYTVKASISKVVDPNVKRVKVIAPVQAETLLNDMAQWSTLTTKLSKLLPKIDSVVNMNDVDTATPENVRSFMNVVSQITTVLIPSITRTNAVTMRKFNSYIRKALEVSRAGSAA